MAQLKTFKYKPWGQYDVIGFLADKYFAAYDNTVTADVTNAGAKVACLYDASKNRNLMTNEQISKILIDNNTEMLMNSSSPLRLKEGYELATKSINSNETKAILELRKNGQRVDSKIIQPSISDATMSDETYYYKKDLGGTLGIVTIAVHFKNVFHGADKDSAAIDGIFQISDTPLLLKTDTQYDKMSIRNVDATNMVVTMDNKDNQITLSKNKDIVLMQDIHIKTADQDGTDAAPLRYYIYSEVPCKC
jgi:S-layer protein (TIGR01567 family)